jgi:hypothetical protein
MLVKSDLIEADKDVQTFLTWATQMHGSLGNVFRLSCESNN